MIPALTVLFGFAWLGEALSRALRLPVPGNVTGMAALAGALLVIDAVRRRRGAIRGFPGLSRVAGGLIASMGVMFVPAGVGVITELDVLRREWLPIAVALAGSTTLGLVVTGLVLNWGLARRPGDAAASPRGPAR